MQINQVTGFNKRLLVFFVFLLSIFLVQGCTYLISGSIQETREEAYEVLAKINNINAQLLYFKGLGSVRLTRNGHLQTARAAWAGSMPHQLRMEIKAVSGQPLIGIANDGQYFYVALYPENKFFKKPSDSDILKRFLSLPIKSDMLLELLAGRIPIMPYDIAILEPGDDDKYQVLLLKKRWHGLVEKIYFEKQHFKIIKIEIYKDSFEPACKIELQAVQKIKQYNIPHRLIIDNLSGDSLHLKIDRYWPDVEINPLIFKLKPPETLQTDHHAN